MRQIKRESLDDELLKIAVRNAERAMLPMENIKKELGIVGDTSNLKRKNEAITRKEWEKQRAETSGEKKSFPGNVAGSKPKGRSALSNRARSGKPDIFMPNVDKNLDPKRVEDFATDKKGLEDELQKEVNGKSEPTPAQQYVPDDAMALAEKRSSEIVAKAGAGAA